jgi:hypothetical protein
MKKEENAMMQNQELDLHVSATTYSVSSTKLFNISSTKFSHKSMGTLQRNKYNSDAARDSKELKRHAAWDMHRDGHKNQKTKLNL